MKNDSFLSTKSYKIQIGIIIKIKKIMNPRGFITKASGKFPFKIDKTDLVEPQEGQGSEVKFLK
nr:hypothetical protein [Flavobacterium sp. I3-2]